MPRMIRFHLDEHVNPRVAAGLRLRGIDVTTTTEAGLLRTSDEDHIAFAVSQNRVIFTQDADFLRLHAAGISHPGIGYCAGEPLAGRHHSSSGADLGVARTGRDAQPCRIPLTLPQHLTKRTAHFFPNISSTTQQPRT